MVTFYDKETIDLRQQGERISLLKNIGLFK